MKDALKEQGTKKYYEKNKETYKARAVAWRKNNREAFKKIINKRNLKVRYGISQETYATLLNSQNGKCAICGVAFIEESLPACVDHCHVTGRVRGLLCKQCNSGIGYLRDDMIIVERAADYLRRVK